MKILFAVVASAVFTTSAWGTAGDDSVIAYMLTDFPRALKIAKPAAEKGDFLAQLILGRLHNEGRGVPKDSVEGEKWFKQAMATAKPLAESGDARAQYAVGRMMADGWGVPKNIDEAVQWYRKGAEQGNGPAQINWGQAHVYGDSVPVDEKEGYKWMCKAAALGYAAAQTYCGTMLARGIGVDKNEADAAIWYRKAADQGFSEAQLALGKMYAAGNGVEIDPKSAFKWYKKAAENGDAEAQDLVGMAYLHGRGVSENSRNAVPWFRKSAEQGYPGGQTSLGIMFRYGAGNVPKDPSIAMAWFRKAAAQGYSPAVTALAQMEAELGIRTTAPAPIPETSSPAASSVSKEDIRDMIQSALKPAAEAPAAKILVSDVDKPGYTTPENPNNFAVVIGVEKYASLPAADFAERDAEAMRAHLMAMGYPARNIFFLSGQQATRAKIAQSVNTWLPGRATPASSVFFYYSGHGAPDPKTSQAYLVPMDGDPEDLDSTAYPIKILYEKLGKLKAKQTIVALDSCFSGAGGRSVLAKGTRPLVGKIDMGGLPESVVALTASDKSQISGTIEDQGHGAFTYYLLKGLEGGAKNGAGRVTVKSLYDYLTPKVRDAARLRNREQTPQLMNPRDTGSALR